MDLIRRNGFRPDNAFLVMKNFNQSTQNSCRTDSVTCQPQRLTFTIRISIKSSHFLSVHCAKRKDITDFNRLGNLYLPFFTLRTFISFFYFCNFVVLGKITLTAVINRVLTYRSQNLKLVAVFLRKNSARGLDNFDIQFKSFENF